MNKKGLAIFGGILSALGVGLSLLTNVVNEKQADIKLDEKVSEKVTEALAKAAEKIES